MLLDGLDRNREFGGNGAVAQSLLEEAANFALTGGQRRGTRRSTIPRIGPAGFWYHNLTVGSGNDNVSEGRPISVRLDAPGHPCLDRGRYGVRTATPADGDDADTGVGAQDFCDEIGVASTEAGSDHDDISTGITHHCRDFFGVVDLSNDRDSRLGPGKKSSQAGAREWERIDDERVNEIRIRPRRPAVRKTSTHACTPSRQRVDDDSAADTSRPCGHPPKP